MSAKFTNEDKEKLRTDMIQLGFKMLKTGGIRSVNIDEITRKCFVAKGSFYTLFESKTEFLYQIMICKRQESKDKITENLNNDGKLPRASLKSYLHWLADENPNIFSYLDGQHTRWLISKWPPHSFTPVESTKGSGLEIILQLS